MSTKLKVAVLGVGSLGKEHARLYADLAAAGLIEFAGVHDTSPQTAARIAEKYHTPVFATLDEAIAGASAFSVVTPTNTHFALTDRLLAAGKHVLVEKPMTDNAAHAAQLVQRAAEISVVLQVGHVERFNPVLHYLEEVATDPRYIESLRISPFPARSTDIGVVLDLMIHDLDVVLALVRSPVASVDAVGIPVLSGTEDIANARLRFANGCVANLTASRVSTERVRKIRVFSAGAAPSWVSLDYRAQEGYILRVAGEGAVESSWMKKLLHAKDSAIIGEFAGKKIVREPVPVEKDEPLKLELQDFIRCIQSHLTPKVSGAAAKRALDLALEITRQIQSANARP
jgi:predicted dehydrogenase